MAVPISPGKCTNLLLSRLPDAEYQALRPHLQHIPTPLRSSFYHRDQPIEQVYFPLSGEHSILAIMQDGDSVEVGTVGNEGFSTVEVLTGSERALETVTCQIPGEALKLPLAKFREATDGKTALRDLVYRYLQAYLAQVSQSVACNRLHTTEERFAKWLLMNHDRVFGDEIQITQEFLASMLGVHRPSVSLIARSFQQLGLIRYSRGVVTILDREALEEASCECYAAVRKQFERALGKPIA
jgi:CRP-like cAMP-binding protein